MPPPASPYGKLSPRLLKYSRIPGREDVQVNSMAIWQAEWADIRFQMPCGRGAAGCTAAIAAFRVGRTIYRITPAGGHHDPKRRRSVAGEAGSGRAAMPVVFLFVFHACARAKVRESADGFCRARFAGRFSAGAGSR
jgi:hypothetical protein